MQEKQDVFLFLEICVITLALGMLSAIAIPHAGVMLHQSKMASCENEYRGIQAAVSEMLDDSTTGKLQSVGPTADMSAVRTCDSPPLVLKDYLPGAMGHSVKLVCTYGFASDGTILQVVP
jgi:hypothetical protein